MGSTTLSLGMSPSSWVMASVMGWPRLTTSCRCGQNVMDKSRSPTSRALTELPARASQASLLSMERMATRLSKMSLAIVCSMAKRVGALAWMTLVAPSYCRRWCSRSKSRTALLSLTSLEKSDTVA